MSESADLVSAAPKPVAAPAPLREEASWKLAVDFITLRIRWFGLLVGYTLVNVISPNEHQWQLNGILTVGMVFSVLDTVWYVRGAVFLERFPLFISLMESTFIAMLCRYDSGFDSPFRLYYFLSLIVCAIRYSRTVTYITLLIHSATFSMLLSSYSQVLEENLAALLLMLVFMAWVTWASTELIGLLRDTGRQLTVLNSQLELRIADRTRELQESQALLVQKEKQAAFGLLAAGIAHEVGNPLAAISSLVQLMNRKPLDEEMHERLGLIDQQLHRIQRTLKELIQFSRPGSQERTRFEVREVIDNALDIAKYYKRKKGRKIVTQYAEESLVIFGVRDQLLQVFLNLILNALDATQEGGTIEIRTASVGGRLQVMIRDDGRGIEPPDREKLFEPYFTTKPTGTGLGLFVSRNILIETGGRIELRESSSAGTMFEVTLPLAR